MRMQRSASSVSYKLLTPTLANILLIRLAGCMQQPAEAESAFKSAVCLERVDDLHVAGTSHQVPCPM